MIALEQVFKNIYPQGNARPHSVQWTVDGSLPYFNGHFPQNPILPGVAIVDASTYLLQRATDQPRLGLKCVINAKFLNPIVPGMNVKIALQSLADNQWQIDWKETPSERMLATLRVQI